LVSPQATHVLLAKEVALPFFQSLE